MWTFGITVTSSILASCITHLLVLRKITTAEQLQLSKTSTQLRTLDDLVLIDRETFVSALNIANSDLIKLINEQKQIHIESGTQEFSINQKDMEYLNTPVLEEVAKLRELIVELKYNITDLEKSDKALRKVVTDLYNEG